MMPQGMPPQAPQMPPQGMFAQMARPMPPQGGMPPGGAMIPPQSTPQQGGVPQGGMQSLPPQIQQMLQMVAQQGRGGDTMLAHLTPGEIAVPPQVQTPKVLATLKKDFQKKGVDPAQFTAGSPQSSKNPATGLPEYNFMSAFLPAALGIAGSVAAPYLAPELLGAGVLSGSAASAIGGGLGTTVGGLAAGQSPTQAALSGIGAGAGGYMLGNLGSGLTAGGNVPGELSQADKLALLQKGITPQEAGAYGINVGGQSAGQAATSMNPVSALDSSLAGKAVNLPTGAASNGMSIFGQKINPFSMAGSALGGYIGGQLGAPPKSNAPNYPAGFNTPMTPLGSLPSAQQQLGMSNSTQPRPSFTGFNPATNYPGSYNFYPSSTSGV